LSAQWPTCKWFNSSVIPLRLQLKLSIYSRCLTTQPSPIMSSSLARARFARTSKKSKPRRTYQEAADAGKRASLLEQRRPNIYAIQIANVQPDEKIVCELHYEQRLSYQDGAYEFVFPMGITPRFHTPSLSAQVAQSLDAPFANPDEQVGGVELHLSIDAGVAIEDPVSPSHTLQLERQDAGHLALSLAAGNIPTK